MRSRQLPLLPLLYVVSVVCLCVGGSAVRDRARPWLDALKETKRYTESEENYTAEKKKKKKDWMRTCSRKMQNEERGSHFKSSTFLISAFTMGDIKITRQREAAGGSLRRLNSEIYGQLGRVFSTMFKPQRRAAGDRDYTAKAISRQVMNLSGI